MSIIQGGLRVLALVSFVCVAAYSVIAVALMIQHAMDPTRRLGDIVTTMPAGLKRFGVVAILVFLGCTVVGIVLSALAHP